MKISNFKLKIGGRGWPVLVVLLVFGWGVSGEAVGEERGVVFRDVTEAAGIRFRHDNGSGGEMRFMPETMGSGCGFADFDGDGDADILLVNCMGWPDRERGRTATMALYRNEGDGTFVDVTREAGLAVEMYGMGCAVGDYDNDGDADVYIACLGANRLFRNEGDGTFSDVTEEMGVGDPGWSVCAVWFDYDRDGDVDLFVGNYLRWTAERNLVTGAGDMVYTPQHYEGEYARLYRNEGGRFVDVSEAAGMRRAPGKAMSAVALDYNGDGWPDIAMSNDTLPDFLFRNNGDGTFTEEGILSGMACSADGFAKAGMGVDAADSRNVGRPDLVIGSFVYEMVSLFWNEGGGYFTDAAFPSGVAPPSANFVTFGVFFFDYDLDGHLDLFVSAGHVESKIEQIKPSMTYAQRPLLYRNLGDGRFVEVGAGSGDLRPLVGRGAAYADYDGDGDLDVLVSANNGRPALLRNDGGNRNRALRVRPVGVESNRSGIGAVVRARTGSAVQTRSIKSGSSYCSQCELVATFGLGEEEGVDGLEVVWPTGRIERLGSVSAGQTVTVREGEGIVASSPFRVHSEKAEKVSHEGIIRTIEGHLGRKAGDFPFRLMADGTEQDLSDYSGKVILLNFWATWCAPCLREIPDLGLLHKTYARDGLVVITLSDEPREKLAAFVERHPFETVNGYVGAADDLPEPFRQMKYGRPLTFIIDREGVIQEYFMEIQDFDFYAMGVQKYF